MGPSKNRRSLDTKKPTSPIAGTGRVLAGVGRALVGILLIILGLVIGVAGMAPIKLHGLGKEILGEGATMSGWLALTVAAWLTLGLGLLLMGLGVFLLGKRGKALSVRIGCLLFFGGIATCLADLLFNDEPLLLSEPLASVRTWGLLAALVGILVMALAMGWLTEGKGGIFDE